MENSINSDRKIKGQDTVLDINSLHRNIISGLDALMKYDVITFTYNPDLVQGVLDGILSQFVNSQTKGYEKNEQLQRDGWQEYKAFTVEKMSDLALEHIKEHLASKIHAAWHQLIIEAIFYTHPELILSIDADETEAKRHERAVSFFNDENKEIEEARRQIEGFIFAKPGRKPKSAEEWKKYKTDLENDLRRVASESYEDEIAWDFLAEKLKYRSGDSLRKAVSLHISDLKALGKKRN